MGSIMCCDGRFEEEDEIFDFLSKEEILEGFEIIREYPFEDVLDDDNN